MLLISSPIIQKKYLGHDSTSYSNYIFRLLPLFSYLPSFPFAFLFFTFIVIHQFFTYYASSVIIFPSHQHISDSPNFLVCIISVKVHTWHPEYMSFIYICMVDLGVISVCLFAILLDKLFIRFCCVSICMFVL